MASPVTGPRLLPLIVLVLVAGCAARRGAGAGQPGAGAVALEPAPPPAAARAGTAGAARNVVLIGDSTTYGTPPPGEGLQSPYNPGATLEVLLARLEPPPSAGGSVWHGARVHNLAVGGSTTRQWLEAGQGCGVSFLEQYPVVRQACASGVSWADAVPLAIGGGPVDAVIVDLGINDLAYGRSAAETVDRLLQIRAALAPAPVLFFPPIAPPGGPRGDWPERVRRGMEARGLFGNPQYPPYLPTFDGLHPTRGGYAAMAGLWVDGLRSLP